MKNSDKICKKCGIKSKTKILNAGKSKSTNNSESKTAGELAEDANLTANKFAIIDKDFEQKLNNVANLEAGTDILVHTGALGQEMAINSGFAASGGISDDNLYRDLSPISGVTENPLYRGAHESTVPFGVDFSDPSNEVTNEIFLRHNAEFAEFLTFDNDEVTFNDKMVTNGEMETSSDESFAAVNSEKEANLDSFGACDSPCSLCGCAYNETDDKNSSLHSKTVYRFDNDEVTTDIEAASDESLIEQLNKEGVTKDAPYQELADYTMISTDDDNNDKNIQNYQGS